MGTINLQVPVSGQPNSTEDPKIASDFNVLQTLLNGNLDTNNLNPAAAIARAQLAGGASFPNRVTAVTTTHTASLGEASIVTCASPFTIALPSPTSGGLILIVGALLSATFSLVPPGGATIFIPASQSFVSSLSMGSAATVRVWLFLADGANWLRILTA